MKKSVTEKVLGSSTTVPSVCTQSSPSIGATALTAWAPRNPINKYYNGTPREVGAQHILLLGPTSTPRSILTAPHPRAPSYSSSYYIVASRRKKDLSYVALSQPLHSSYTPALGSSSTTSAKLRLPPRRPVALLRTNPLGPGFRCHPPTSSNRTPPARPRAPPAGVSRSLSAFFSSSRSPPPAATRPFTGPRAHHRLHFTFLVAN